MSKNQVVMQLEDDLILKLNWGWNVENKCCNLHIPGYFSNVYKDLYNSAGDKEELLELK